MKTQRATLEVIAPTVEEAIEKGLDDLAMSQEEVNVEILDEGSRGLFGLGSRQARIRLTVKAAPGEAASEPAPIEDAPKEEPPVPSARPTAKAENVPGEKIVLTPEEEDYELDVAHQVISELLSKMQVKAHIEAIFGQPDEGRSRAPILVDITGSDLTVLIGRRAETLNALQYIASLIIAKRLGHGVTLVVDVEGYRERRQNQIRQLARRMADQAVKTGRRQILEPMPANERRVIHMELRDNTHVRTESVGEDPYRKVTIVPVD